MIIQAVAEAGEDGAAKHWAVVAQRLMGAASPTSLAVTHRAIEEGRQLSLGACRVPTPPDVFHEHAFAPELVAKRGELSMFPFACLF